MGLYDWIKGVTFLEVIEWLDPSKDTIVFRYPTYDKMIKSGAQLTVRESQAAVFVNEGRVADVFQPGRHVLTTNNLPIMVALKALAYGATTPFKAEVYFVNLRQFTNLKWGTPNPILLNTSDFGPVRIRAFGTFAFRVVEPARFLSEVVGTNPRFPVEGIFEQVRSQLVQQFTVSLAQAQLGVFQMAGQYQEISNRISGQISSALSGFGLGLTQFVIENITLPEAVEKALDERGRMTAIGNLDQFTKLKAAEALGDAARSGGAGDALQLGAGFVMAQNLANQLNTARSAPAMPDPLAATAPGAVAPTPPGHPAPPAVVATPGQGMIACPNCQAPTFPGKFCSQCGKPMAAGPKMCSGCQRELPPGARFCPTCGTSSA